MKRSLQASVGLRLTNPLPVDSDKPTSPVPPVPRKAKGRRKLLPGQRLLGHGLRLEFQPAKTS